MGNDFGIGLHNGDNAVKVGQLVNVAAVRGQCACGVGTYGGVFA